MNARRHVFCLIVLLIPQHGSAEPPIRFVEGTREELRNIEIHPKDLPPTTSEFIERFGKEISRKLGKKLYFQASDASLKHFQWFLSESPDEHLGIVNDYDPTNPFATYSLKNKHMNGEDVILNLCSQLGPVEIVETEKEIIIRMSS